MGPTRNSRSVNKRYINDVSPTKDGDSTKRSNSKKRKLSDMLGPQWTMEELSRFYDAYRKYNEDWEKVAGAVRKRSPEMVEALHTMNRAYLSLPHGAASAAGLIAMMTDHYCNLAGSESDQEDNAGAGSSQKSQKRACGKVQPTTSKASSDQFVSHSQTVASNFGCLPFLKKKRSVGSRPCPVGKRTPRFPVPFSYDNISGDKYVSPTNQGLKLKANANVDEVAHEITIALAEASQGPGAPQVSHRRAANVMSPFRHTQGKHCLEEMPSNQIAAAKDEKYVNGSTKADAGDLSRYKNSKMESKSFGTVKERTTKLKGNKFENHLDDTKEEYSETEEGQTFGAPREKLHLEVANSKISRKESKKVPFRRDEAAAFDALLTLADLSLMLPTENEDDSKLLFQDAEDDHVDELVAAEGLPSNRKKGQHKYSGVRMKGHQQISSSNVDSCKTSKPGEPSIIVGSLPEENQQFQIPITRTPRKKQKMQASKIQKSKADPDIHINGHPGVEDGDPGKKLRNKTKKSSQSGVPLRSSENSSCSDLQKEASISAEQVLVINQVDSPSKVKSRHKPANRKPQIQKDLKFADKFSNDQSDRAKENLSICLSNPRLRRWCMYEWFYSAIDYPWFAKREFVEYLHHSGLGHVPRFNRADWGIIKSSLGKPRRFSEQFLKEEKEKLNQYRDSVRKHYTKLREGVQGGFLTNLAWPLSVGQRVSAVHPKTREIHDGSVLTVDHSGYRVQFDCRELGVEAVMDIDCMPLNSSENMPAVLGQRTISVNKFSENFNELKVNGREFVKLCTVDNANNIDDPQLSLSANPASLFKLEKVSSTNANQQKPIGSAKTYSQPSAPAHIQAKEADVQALAHLTRTLEKKEAIVVELRHLNDDVSGNQKNVDCSLQDSEPFKRQYATILVQLNEANKQVSSAVYCLRQRNSYQRNNPADQTSELGPHVSEILDSSKAKAQAMVDAAMQAMSSLKGKENTIEKIEEAVDYVNDRLPSDDSSMPAAPNRNASYASGMEPQVPSELISKCVATLLMIQKCTQRQFPPSDVAQILNSAVTSLRPQSSRNLPVYAEIQQCMGIIRSQIMALVPS